MPWDRKQRQEAILREKIAVLILDRLSDPRLGFITVTNVELSRDKKIAKVFYTVLGTDAQIRSTARALADSRGRLQELLSPSLNMRSMPELRFIFNEQVQRESKLLDLIGDVTAERVDRAGPDEELEDVGLQLGEPLELAEEAFDFETLGAEESWTAAGADDAERAAEGGEAATAEGAATDADGGTADDGGDASPDAAVDERGAAGGDANERDASEGDASDGDADEADADERDADEAEPTGDGASDAPENLPRPRGDSAP